MNGLLHELKKAESTTMSNYNHNLVKIHRNYTFEELAGVFDVHKNTIANWVKDGLPCLKERRPFLIMGVEAREFLKAQRVSKKQSCKPNEFYCMRCKKPTKPAEDLVEFLPISTTKGRLMGFCSCCECVVNKFIGCASLERYAKIFDLIKPTALEHIKDSDNPLLNCDFEK
jgi:hypothetical protein